MCSLNHVNSGLLGICFIFTNDIEKTHASVQSVSLRDGQLELWKAQGKGPNFKISFAEKSKIT